MLKNTCLFIILFSFLITGRPGTPSGAVSYTGIIIAHNGLNVRKAPSIRSKKIAKISQFEQVVINGRTDRKETIDGITDFWFNISYTRPYEETGEITTGYVFGGYLLRDPGISASRLDDYKRILLTFMQIRDECFRSSLCVENNSFMQGIAYLHYHLRDTDKTVFKKSIDIVKNKKALQAFLDFAYKNKKQNLLGSSFNDYYAFYKDALHAYLKVYLVLLKECGREQVITDFSFARKALGQKPDRDGLVPFYKNYMISHNLDLKANILHRKRNFTAVGFWIRRIIDGTDTVLFKAAVKIVKENDKQFYSTYITGNGIQHEALKKFPRATLKADFLLPAWWEDQNNRKVTILKRRQNFDYLDYFVELDGKRAWISAYHLSFNRYRVSAP